MATVASWSSSADAAFFTNSVGGAPTISSGGSYGERYNFANGTAQNYGTKTISATSDLSLRFLWTVSALPSSSFMICSVIDSTSTIQWRVDFATGFLRIRNSTAAVATASTGTTLTTGTEYWIKVWRSGTTLTVSAFDMSGTQLQTVTGTVGGAAATTLYLGNNAALTGTLGTTTYDEIILTDSGTEPTLPAGALTASVTLSPLSAAPPFTLTATFTASGGTGTYTYAVTDWGDGSSTAAQSNPVITKTFTSAYAAGTKTLTWTVTG